MCFCFRTHIVSAFFVALLFGRSDASISRNIIRSTAPKDENVKKNSATGFESNHVDLISQADSNEVEYSFAG